MKNITKSRRAEAALFLVITVGLAGILVSAAALSRGSVRAVPGAPPIDNLFPINFSEAVESAPAPEDKAALQTFEAAPAQAPAEIILSSEPEQKAPAAPAPSENKQSSAPKPAKDADSGDNTIKTMANPKDGFAYANGTEFYINGKQFYFAGTNNYFLRYGDFHCVAYSSDRGCTREVLDDTVKMNLSVIRTWGFTDGSYYWGSLQPQMGVYSEKEFAKLDLLIREAGDRNLKLILPFVNNWPEYGGMCQYVHWCNVTDASYCSPYAAEGTQGASSHDAFYTDPCARDAYKDYVNYVLNRTNTLTGVKYKDDPSIFAWELANEPRAKSDPSMQILDSWIEEMSSFIKGIDQNHMVTTGLEGFSSSSEGADFTANHNHTCIDFATFHLYPDHWGLTEQQSLDWIEQHLNDSKSVLGKPAIIEEFGKKGALKDDYMSSWYSLIESSNADGNLFWHLLDLDYQWDDGFGIKYPENASTAGIITNDSAYWKDYTMQISPFNTAPQIQQINDLSVNEGDVVDIPLIASDADNDYIFYSISDAYRFDRHGSSFRWQTEYKDAGNYTITIEASDGIAKTSRTFNVEVKKSLGCLIPSSGMQITSDAVLCAGNYSLPDGIGVGSDIELDCNGSWIYGGIPQLEGITLSGKNTRIKNCNMANFSHAVQLLSAFNATIENSYFGNGVYHGINIQKGGNSTFANNTFHSNYDIGIYCYQSSGNLISKNNFDYNGKGVYFDNCADNVVEGNSFLRDNGGGVFLTQASKRNFVANNTMYLEGASWRQGAGVYLSLSSSNIIEGNNITLCYNAVSASSGASNRISGNSISGFQYGLMMYDEKDDEVISNEINIQTGYPIYLSNSEADIELNNIYSGQQIKLKVATGLSGTKNATAKLNWWNATYCSEIASMIEDCRQNSSVGCVSWEPILDAPYPKGKQVQCIDNLPPGEVTGLSSTSQGDDWIYWEWSNPADFDFEESIISINGVNAANISGSSYNLTGLAANSSYTISINTKDIHENVNTQDVVNTVVLGALPELIDLNVKSARLYSENPAAGTWTTFQVVLENTGNSTADGFYWNFYPGSEDKNLSYGPMSLKPGETADIYPAVKYSAKGEYIAVFKADNEYALQEPDKANNQAPIPVSIV